MSSKNSLSLCDTATTCDTVLAAPPEKRMRLRQRIAQKHGMEELPVRSVVAHEIIRLRKVYEELLSLHAPRGKRAQWKEALSHLEEGNLQEAIDRMKEAGAVEALAKIGAMYRSKRPDIAMQVYVAADMAHEALAVLTKHKNADEETLRWLLKQAEAAISGEPTSAHGQP